jgi:hypothetical protein
VVLPRKRVGKAACPGHRHRHQADVASFVEQRFDDRPFERAQAVARFRQIRRFAADMHEIDLRTEVSRHLFEQHDRLARVGMVVDGDQDPADGGVAVRSIDERTGGRAKDQRRNTNGQGQFGGHRAVEQPIETRAAVAGHHDQVRTMLIEIARHSVDRVMVADADLAHLHARRRVDRFDGAFAGSTPQRCRVWRT